MPGEVDESIAPAEGREVRLTIDVELQRRLEQLFASTGRTGSIAVIDVQTCDVLALVSWPVYDLNRFWRDYEKLEDDRENLPLVHRAVYYTCAPGSTVKPITALAGLGEGIINTSTEINCNGSNTRSRKGVPHCWIHKFNTGHGSLSVVPAVRHSCNIFFVETAHRMRGESLSKWFGFFGFGRRPGTGLPSERPGSAGPEGRPYVPSDAWFMSIGQGVADASCLQVANAMATIARSGRFLSPRICRDSGPRQEARILQLSEAHLKAVRRGMYDVINDPDGTAYKPWHRELPLDVEVCGKTGTAQVPPMRIDSNNNGRIDTEDRIVKKGDHAWFAGFAPYRMPRLAFAVVVEYSGSGGKYAAPVAKETLRWCRKMGYLETD
jgi:penicillin-binding protein 2